MVLRRLSCVVRRSHEVSFWCQGTFTSAAKDLTAQLLRVNPDNYSVWNYRRQILFASGETAPESWKAPPDVAQEELVMSAEALKRQPKSYPAWYHRKWILDRLESGRERTLQSELQLCARFLDRDERNFHCWKYRRYVAHLAGVTPEENYEYTEVRRVTQGCTTSPQYCLIRVRCAAGSAERQLQQLLRLSRAISHPRIARRVWRRQDQYPAAGRPPSPECVGLIV